MLPGLGLALRELDGDASRVHAVADRADQVLVLRRLEDVVVEHVVVLRREVAVAPRRRLVVALAKHEELEL